ncbi:MAG TPA: ATP-binding cassette domain-containing protein [bacterium]|nr:ATP-binding cassette domain-containing protein [bacterium]
MIKVWQLSKSFGKNSAVDSIGFNVEPGEIVAFAGPNGAGKSTTLRMLSTYLVPDSGSISIDGFDAVENPLAVRNRIGYMPESNILYEGMRVDRFLKFIAKAHWLSPGQISENLDWVVDKCRLEDVLYKKIYQCSKGYHRRIALAMALIHKPGVLLLDEPTHGLDPLQVLALRDFIKSLKPNRAILFSTHIIQEVTAVCDRMLVINAGKIIAAGTNLELALKAGFAPWAECCLDQFTPAAKNALVELKCGNLIESATKPDGSIEAVIGITQPGLEEELEALVNSGLFSMKSFKTAGIDTESVLAELLRKSPGDEE